MSLSRQHGASSDGIFIFLIGRDDHLHYPSTASYIAEELCFAVARHCHIGPATRHLFALRFLGAGEPSSPGGSTWLSPCQTVTVVEGQRLQYEFRLRFRTPTVDRLQVDPSALDYYFHQIRSDFLAGSIPDALKSQDKVLGLAVTDMLRVIKETGTARELVEKDYKKYLPRELMKNMLVTLGIRKAIRKPLLDVEQSDIDIVYIKAQYVRQVSELSSQYGCEEYVALVDENGQVMEVTLQVHPIHPSQPGLRLLAPGKKKSWIHVCTIEELCSVSMRKDGTVEISRRNGVPQYFKFQDTSKMYSFISLLDGYYRLMEKWIFNLCKDLTSPALLSLRALKCHGPVGRSFSYKKLQEKRQNKPGCYILREGWDYDSYCVDVCIEGQEHPHTLVIERKTSSGIFQIRNDPVSLPFGTIPELLAFYGEQRGIPLKECVPPSEYDTSQLLLCRVDKESPTSSGTTDLITSPLCISRSELSLNGHEELAGRLTTVSRGTWRRSPTNVLKVAIKRLVNTKDEGMVNDFLQVASQCLFWQCEAILGMYGIVLANPLSMVTEYLPLGPLHRYLRNHRDSLQEVDLVEAATYLGKALWYLVLFLSFSFQEEHGFVHGNIRCRNLLVLSREENSFKIKLADPGVALYEENQIHWIPPEYYHYFAGVKHSMAADVWAFATTLWEIFSFGDTPLRDASFAEIKQLYKRGVRLPQPESCHEDVYKLMKECWNSDADVRKKPQAIMRDINQTLYEVHNSRRTHAYSTIYARDDVSLHGSSKSLDNQNNSIASHRYENQSQSIDTATTTLAGSSCSMDSNITTVGTECLMDRHVPPVCQNTRLLNPDQGSTVGVLGSLTALTISPSTVSLDSMMQDSHWWLIEMNQLKLLDKLGQGFYGEVRRAMLTRWSGLEEQEVAVKQLKPTYESSGYHDLLREISIMKSLQHKNIVEIKGVVEDPKTLLVMEYVPLGSLLIYIRTHKHRLTEKKLLMFSADIAEGMEYLGQRRIIHRDLAARNILVASANTVKISDFGLAQMTGQKEYYKLKTNRELPVRWYAPETIRHWKFTFKSDVWSFGVTLWEMFSYGEEPIIEGCKDDELLQTLESGKRLRCPSTCSVCIYTHLMRKCWEEVDEQRPDFAQLLTDIRELYDNS